MKLKNKKNITVIPLLLITLGLWGTIIYNIVQHFSTGATDETEQVNYSLSPKSTGRNVHDRDFDSDVSYKELERDPFSFGRIKKERTEENPSSVIKTVTPLPVKPKLNFKINGVIVKEKSRLVILEDMAAGATVFLREGDEYKGVEIRSIEVNKVIIMENNEIREIYTSK